LTDTQICEGFSTKENPFTTTMMRAGISIASNQQRQERINEALRLKDRGWSNVAIGDRMGLNESTVRGLLAPGAKDKADILTNTANILRRQVDEHKLIDIGSGVELQLDVSRDKLNTAVAVLQEEGYRVHTVPLKQLGTGKDTKLKTLSPPDTTWGEAAKNVSQVKQIQEFNDAHGRKEGNLGIQYPLSINSKRVAIRYAEHGGAEADGVIYVRPGVKDISIGSNKYAQVRVAVDNTHYLKGMAMYKEDLPDGVDLMFNTNKSNTGNKHDAMKPLKTDPETGKIDRDNPFGAQLKRQFIERDKDGNEKLTSTMNIVREEGDWEKWTRALSSQILSKQSPELAHQQLEMTYERKRQAFDEITALTNPAVRKKLLTSFADGADNSAVHLKAATLPGSAYHVILPVSSVKPDEVYAPNFKNGTRLALIRSPHGGTFEIPELTVNNRNAEARRLIGPQSRDAVGIHHQVAERLSGADFDGDFVIAVPNDKRHIKSTPALEGLANFDPKRSFPPYDGMPTIDGGKYNAHTKQVEYGKKADGTPRNPTSRSQLEMGKVTNLIADMTIRGANNQEKARAVRHSMVVIDADKHTLDWKGSYETNGIAQLKEKYQSREDTKGLGASTIVTRSNADFRVPERRLRRASEGGSIDPVTGKKIFVPTGRTYVDRAGNVKRHTTKSTLGAEVEDAFKLSSGTPIEAVYANYSNKTKALANAARKEFLATKPIPYSPSAKKTYSKEVASLDAKLNLAIKNRPLERQAQALANAVYSQKYRAKPHMDEAEKKKIKNQALREMRVRTGANKTDIPITQEEWNAIQAGAISTHKLEQILEKTDLDRVKELATPRTEILMTPAKQARAASMANLGYTQAEIAEQLGVSLTTLKTSM
jgi:DNA-binding CsgD family transcriptional regulator